METVDTFEGPEVETKGRGRMGSEKKAEGAEIRVMAMLATACRKFLWTNHDATM